MILAGDVGGTKTHLALYETADGPLWAVRESRFLSRQYPDLPTLVGDFIEGDAGRVESACFGIAGPVVDGRCTATNLSWEVDEHDFAHLLPGVTVRLVNDLVATARGVLELPHDRLLELQPGVQRARATRALLAPGTGLGQSVLYWDRGWHAAPAEAGHADFAPRDREEIALLEHLLARGPRVTAEHVLAGPGLSRIYDFLRDTGRAEEPAWLARELAAAPDRNAAISALAARDGATICALAFGRWLSLLGSEAGNLALRSLAAGGIYLAGGIVDGLAGRLRDSPFLSSFRAKPPLEAFLATVPVQVVLEEKAALFGAARLARGE